MYILNVLIASVKPRRVILNTHAHQAEASLYLFSRQIEVGLFMTHLGEWGPSGKKVSPSCLRLLSVPSWPPSGPGDTTDTQHSSVRRSLLMLWNGVHVPGPQASQGLQAGTGRVLY